MERLKTACVSCDVLRFQPFLWSCNSNSVMCLMLQRCRCSSVLCGRLTSTSQNVCGRFVLVSCRGLFSSMFQSRLRWGRLAVISRALFLPSDHHRSLTFVPLYPASATSSLIQHFQAHQVIKVPPQTALSTQVCLHDYTWPSDVICAQNEMVRLCLLF